jgi:hypothetical protein
MAVAAKKPMMVRSCQTFPLLLEEVAMTTIQETSPLIERRH